MIYGLFIARHKDIGKDPQFYLLYPLLPMWRLEFNRCIRKLAHFKAKGTKEKT